MKNFHFITIILILMSAFPSRIYAQSTDFQILKKVKVKGDGKWDFVTFDEQTRRLYISHGTSMQVMDVEKETIIGEVQNTPGIHGIAVVNTLNKGFTSNGKDSTVTVFDLKTFATLKTIKIPGSSPDHIIYDTFSKNIFVFNNKSNNVSIINPQTNEILKTVSLGGKPELSVSTKKGKIFVNLEDAHEIVELDAKTLEVTKRWPLAPGEEPTGLALDTKNHRLFSTCANKLLIVLDATNGKVITTLPIGEKVDGVAYDETEKKIYTSNGEGTVTIIKQETKDKYVVEKNIQTAKGAKTLAFDKKKHRLYIPCSDFTTVAPTPENPSPKPSISTETFGILIIGKK